MIHPLVLLVSSLLFSVALDELLAMIGSVSHGEL